MIAFSDNFTLGDASTVEGGANLNGGTNSTVTQTGGTMSGAAVTKTYTQSGGTMNGSATADLYSQSGGSLAGGVTAKSYDLVAAAATSTSNATIKADTSFLLEPASGKATVNAKLTGTGKLTKSGVGIVVLANTSNDFSGGVEIDAGTLQAIDDALPDNAAVTIAQNATLEMTISKDVVTSFNGAISGSTGLLVKDGAGTLALGKPLLVGEIDIDAGTLHLLNGALPASGKIEVADNATLQVTVDSGKSATYSGTMTGADSADPEATGNLVKDGAGSLTLASSVYLGGLDVAAGKLNIGTGLDPNSKDVASFESAIIESGATVYVAKYATLTIRVPNNIVNNGFLINDGTVNDDLDNNATFNNNAAYHADVASNTGTINNNTPGVWEGNILSNAGQINNNAGASWQGTVNANLWRIYNWGTWTGDVNGNGSTTMVNALIENSKGGTWVGDVVNNNAAIHNVAGTWRGNVLDNYSLVMNDNSATELDNAYWYGNVVANHKMVFNAGGGIWTGDVLSNSGYIKNDRASHHTVATDVGIWNGDIYGNTGTIESRGQWNGAVRANSAGAIVVNVGTWSGNVLTNAGTIKNVEDDTGVPTYDKIRPGWTGNVLGNTGIIINMSADWIGDVQANTGTITNSRGTYNGFSVGDSTWSGKVVTNGGTITNANGSTWTGDVLANAGTITNAGIWTGNFTNSVGGTVKAQNQIVGTFANAGTLKLTGNLTGITTLTNTGLLDLHNGTTAGQTLTAATANLQSGSFLAVSVDTAGNTDKLVTTGTANLGGTVRLTLNPISGNYDYTKTYTILTAGTRSGSFAGLTTDLAFLDPQLSYGTPGAVNLTLQRNAQTFDQVGTTSNQKTTAAAVEALGMNNPLYGAILSLTAAEADNAFDQLSGISQGSTQTADIQAANLISSVLTSRLDQAFDAIGDGASGRRVDEFVATQPIVSHPDPTSGIWGQFYGALGSSKGTATIAGSDSSTGGIALGLDGQLANWRVGVLVQAGTTGTSVPDLNSTTSSFDYGTGLYAGADFGSTRLAFGASYTQHAVGSTRHVTFPGVDETLTATYGAETAQAFAQISQNFDFGATAVTPYANVEFVANRTDPYTETGGAAALTSSSSLIDATFTALGVNVSHQVDVGDGMMMTVDGGLGWRHTFAGTPSAMHSFAGGTAFSVLGGSMPTDLALVSAGANLDITDTTTIDLSYDGQFSPSALTHSVKATWNGKF